MKNILLLSLVLCFASNAYPQKYVKVWSDEFNTPGLPDSTKWDFLNQKGYNDELQYYTTKESKNAWIEDTSLIIEVRKENYLTANYTSAMLVSRYKGDWLYGKFEIRAKVPTGKGTWPAIWMMPTNDEYGGWPKSGEVDIMEYVGWDASRLHYNVHYEGTNGTGHESTGAKTVNVEPYNKFITFTLVWTPTKIEWYQDNQMVHTYTKTADDPRVWPFDKMFFMMLNLAYGGWGGQQGIDDTKLPHKFYVDYVRIYQLQESAGPFSLTIAPPTNGTVEVSPKMDAYPEGTMVTVTATPAEKYEFDKWLNVGSANPITLEIAKDTKLIPVFKKKNEVILNGDFSQGLKVWSSLYFQDATIQAATTSVVDSMYIVNVTKPGTANWNICLQQGLLPIEKDATYLVTFDASADVPGSLDVYLAKNHGDYGYYYSTVKTISRDMQKYSWTFKMLQTSDANCRFGFGFGKFTGNVYFDNVSIEKLVPTGIEPINGSLDESFELYPNPASDFLEIKNRSAKTLQPTITLCNLQGQVISNLWENQSIAAGQHIRINLKRYNSANGIYLINISTANKSVSRKLILNRP